MWLIDSNISFHLHRHLWISNIGWFHGEAQHCGFMSRSALSLSVELSCYRSKTLRRSWWNFMKEQQGVSHTAILGHVGKWVRSPLCPRQQHPLVSSYRRRVREGPPRRLISYIIRETAGRGCRQLTLGCRGRISCDFSGGFGCGIYSYLMSHVSGPTRHSGLLPKKTARFSSLTPNCVRLISSGAFLSFPPPWRLEMRLWQYIRTSLGRLKPPLQHMFSVSQFLHSINFTVQSCISVVLSIFPRCTS